MIELTVDKRELRELEAMVKATRRKLPNELKIAINATARKTKTTMSRQVRQELATSAKAVNRTVKITSKATRTSLHSNVRLSKTARVSLKEYKARHTRSGVSYKISKRQGRKTVAGAFMGPKPGATAVKLRGHAFKRVGKKRLPIQKLHGPSPWGVFKVQKLKQPTVKATRQELTKQIRRRIRFLRLKKSGTIK